MRAAHGAAQCINEDRKLLRIGMICEQGILQDRLPAVRRNLQANGWQLAERTELGIVMSKSGLPITGRTLFTGPKLHANDQPERDGAVLTFFDRLQPQQPMSPVDRRDHVRYGQLHKHVRTEVHLAF
jgi:hypothetical protein